MSQRTPLYDAHRRRNGRLVDFAGWELPLHYGSQIEEHEQVRQACGVFDVSHMLAIDVEGGEAMQLLRYALANDAAKLAEIGRAQYTLMLNEAGGVEDDLIVYRTAANGFRIVANAATGDADVSRLQAVIDARRFDAELAPRRDLAILAVQGPQAEAVLATVLPEQAEALHALKRFRAHAEGDWFMARTGYTGEDGFEVLLPAAGAEGLWERLCEAGARPAGLGARDTLRLEAGLPLNGHEMEPGISAYESGLGWCVDLEAARDFIGREAMEVARPTRTLLGLVIEGSAIARAGTVVSTEHGEGLVTSGSFGPTAARALALARVPLAVRGGDAASVLIRGKSIAARAVTLPFVRRGQVFL